MTQTCKTCRHPQRAHIDVALLQGEPERSIAKRFDLPHLSVHRHRKHIATAIVHAHERRELAHREALATELERLYADNRDISERAKGEGDLKAAVHANREQRSLIEFVAKRADEEKNRADPLSFPEVVQFLNDIAAMVRGCASCSARIEALRGQATSATPGDYQKPAGEPKSGP